MNEFHHPSPEALAAFVDGRLAGDERAEVVAHLDRCRDCYEVFAGTVRFQRQEEPRGRVLRPARFGAPQWVWWAAAAAAVLVVAIVVPVVWEELGLGGRDGEGEVRLAAELASALEAGGIGASLATWEGWLAGERGFASVLDRERASFRVGVRLMDLAAVARAGELGAAGPALADLADLLASAGAAEELEEEIDAARKSLRGEDAEALGRAAARLEAGAEGALDPFNLAFGKWAEAGRLAAASGQAELFRSPAFTGFREVLGERELPEPVARVLGEIDALTRVEPRASEDIEGLEEMFGRLVLMY
jgi:hypothetical protein